MVWIAHSGPVMGTASEARTRIADCATTLKTRANQSGKGPAMPNETSGGTTSSTAMSSSPAVHAARAAGPTSHA
jgi:hypothetical protein